MFPYVIILVILPLMMVYNRGAVQSICCNCEGPKKLWLWNCLSKGVSGQEIAKKQKNKNKTKH